MTCLYYYLDDNTKKALLRWAFDNKEGLHLKESDYTDEKGRLEIDKLINYLYYNDKESIRNEVSQLLSISTTVEGIRNILLSRTDGKESFNDKYILKEFKFYHAETVEAIKEAFNEAKRAYGNVEGQGKPRVTELAGMAYGEKPMPEFTMTESGKAAKLDWDFRPEFGDIIHKVFQLDEDQWGTLKPQIEELFIRYAEKISDSMMNPHNSISDSTIRLLSFIRLMRNALVDQATKDKCFDLFFAQLRETKQQLENEYGSIKFVEWEIASRGDLHPEIVTGHIDLAFITPDKKVVIVDFKTTPNTIGNSEKTLGYHWIQLELYKRILMDYGVKEGDISFKNIIIQYLFDAGGPSWKITEENPEEKVSRNARELKERITRKYFPNEVAIGPDISEKIELARRQTDILCPTLKTRKLQEVYLRQRILEYCKNEQTQFCYQVNSDFGPGKTVKYILGSDKNSVTIINPKNNEKIKENVPIDDFVQAELAALMESQIVNFEAIKPLIINKQFEQIKLFISRNNNAARTLWSNIYPYLSDDYEYISIPELEKLQIICMRHINGTYDFIKIAAENRQIEYSPNPSDPILSYIIKDKSILNRYQETGDTLRASVGNMHLMSAALIVPIIAEKIPNFKLGSIKFISTVTGQQAETSGIDDSVELTMRLLSTFAANNSEIENIDLFKDVYANYHNMSKESFDEHASKIILSACRATAYEEGIEALAFDNWNERGSLEAKIQAIEDARAKLRQDAKTSQLLSRNTEEGGVQNAIDYCDKLLARLNLILKGRLGKSQMHDIASYGISFKESFIAGYNLLTKAAIERYTLQGTMITGLAQALESSVSYASPDEISRRFVSFYDSATAQIRTQIQAEATELNEAAEKFIKWGRTIPKYKIGISDPIYGNHDLLYQDLLQKGPDGSTPALEMRFINPYTSNELTDEQKEFLEVLLWSINRHRIKGFDAKTLSLSYAELKLSSSFESYKSKLAEDQTWLNMPLRRNDGSNGTFKGMRAVLSGKKTIKEFINAEVDRMRHWVEPENLSESLRQAREEAIKNLEWHNYYKENDQNRATKTESESYLTWDINLNRLAIDYMLSDIRETYFTHVLKMADSLLGEIKLMELTTGKDFSKQYQALLNRIKVSVYGRSLVDSDWQDVLAGMGVVKLIMSIAKISVRPMLFVKEMLLGRIRNTSAILAGMIQNGENKITMQHLTEAAGIVFGPEFFGKNAQKLFGQLSIGTKSMVDVLNDVYGINDRDLSVIGEKVAYDSYGLHNWGSRMLYLNTIAPDWFNRMILFVAKMKADGTWDAHTLKDGKLIYDMSKDDRIKEFWNNREHPKNTPEYKKAEAYYKLRMQQFAAEGWKRPDGSALRYGQINPETGKPEYDAFPRAYTSREEDSIKEQIGMIYGYYSHDERANMQKSLWWTMYTLFLTFMPAEIRKYLAVGTESSIINTILEKDPVTGENLYWEEQDDPENPDGPKLHVKTTREFDDKHRANAPVLKDVYNAYEGLAVSTVKTVGQLCRGDLKSIRENPLQLRNTELFLFNLLFAAIIASIVAYLSDLGVKSTGVDITADLLKKTGRELDFYHSVLEPVEGFGFVGTDFLQSTFTNAFKTIKSQGYSLYDLSEDTFAIVKDAHLNLDVA